MPLNTEIVRDGEALTLKWSDFHIAAMIVASMLEHPDDWGGAKPNDGIDYPTEPQPISRGDSFQLTNYSVIGAAFPTGSYTLQKEHRFEDATDGEVLHLLPGDQLRAWRS